MVVDHKERVKTFFSTGQFQNQQNSGYPSGIYQYLKSPILPELSRKLFKFGKSRINRQRAIFKNGYCNVHYLQMKKLGIRYILDCFTSLVDIQWRWTLLAYMLAYFVSWLIFALIWWLIMFTHGDLEDEHLPTKQAESSWTPCVLGIHNFTSCYLFSLETQYTVGYGVRVITEECPQAIFVMSMQSIIGMTIDSFFIGIAFAKLTRPKRRTQTILFSKNALIAKQDGNLCLLFRVGDMRKNPLIGTSIRAQLIKPKKTKEGEHLKAFRTELNLSSNGGSRSLFLMWPLTIVHKIDEESPFYNLSAKELLQNKFEIIVALEASVESTGQSIQARTSYVTNEILWGHKFEPVVDHLKDDASYAVIYSRFDNTYSVDTPLCSAADLDKHYANDEVPPELPKLPAKDLLTDKDQASKHHYEEPSISAPPRSLSRPLPPIPSHRRRNHILLEPLQEYEEENPLPYGSSYV